MDLPPQKNLDDAGADDLALAGQLLEALERERASLARVLHGVLGSKLTAINLDVTSVAQQLPEGAARERLERALRVLKDAVDEKRHLIQSLRPITLDNLGLAATLSMDVDAFGERTGIACSADLSDEVTALDGDAEIALYRVVEDTLQHLETAGGATRVALALRVAPARVTLSLETDGVLPDSRSPVWRALTARLQRLQGELARDTLADGVRLHASVPRGDPRPVPP